MKSVLFVDDDQQVLDGLRDLLRKHRKLWQMEFANGAERAIELLVQRPFDVVVSDMRMPGMDGADLLAYVKERQPTAARIILSGQADRDSVLRAIPVAHQFLSKPCDAETLRQVIERACALQQLLGDSNIRAVVGRLDHLPSAPQTYWDLTRAAARADAGVAEFAQIVEQDPAMSLKVLQLVNSAYFGLAQRITSVQQAVARLGVEVLKALALSVHAFSALKAPPVRGFSIETLQQHSLLTARIGRSMFDHAGLQAEIFSAAVVHDIGRLVLVLGVPDEFGAILEEQAHSKQPFHEVERACLGISHAEVGAYLLGSWGLPFRLVEAVAFHHGPAGLDPSSDLATALHIADALADRHEYRSEEPERQNKLDLGFVGRAGLQDKLERWRALAAALD